MTSDEKISGGCMCGAVRYKATGRPTNIAYCHCSDCRGYTGAPVMVWVAFESTQVRYLQKKPKIYKSSLGVGWGFCDQCGSSLTWEADLSIFGGRKVMITEFTISSLDTPEKFVPDQHWHDGERNPWFDVVDNLPRYHKLRFKGAEPTHHGPKVGVR